MWQLSFSSGPDTPGEAGTENRVGLLLVLIFQLLPLIIRLLVETNFSFGGGKIHAGSGTCATAAEGAACPC